MQDTVAQPGIQTFGKYQIIDRIATGGMAEIYKARLEGIGGFQRTFAIKRILPNLSQNSDYIAMLVDEAKVAGLLSHANIVQILDLGQVDRIWYIAMEYVDGRDLGAILRRANKKGLCLPVPHAVFIAIELLKGLEYAHGRQVMRGGRPVALNIIHRDVSPPNILMSFQGEVKLTDFGIARASLKAMETVSGIVKGRFDYMSPEQAEGVKDLDQRSDLFSVGTVLYEMLTGKHPFRHDNEIATVERIRTGTYEPVSKRNPEVPFVLETIVDRALRVDRNERYPSATAFKEALDKFFHDAGFIFTHATLATYLRGLFPEASPRARRGADAVSAIYAQQDTEVDELEARDDTAALRASGHFDEDEQAATVIRSNPLVDVDKLGRALGDQGNWGDVSTLLRPTPEWAKEEQQQATVIRKRPQELNSLDLESVVDEEPLGSDFGDVLERSVSAERPRPAPSQPRRSGWAGWAFSVITLLGGVIFGAVVALGLAWAVGFRPVARLAPPNVRVLAPQGTAVILNGDAVGSDMELPALESQHLEIRRGSELLWEQHMMLPAGASKEIIIIETGSR